MLSICNVFRHNGNKILDIKLVKNTNVYGSVFL